MYSSSTTIEAQNLPDVADQLDTIAEHDLDASYWADLAVGGEDAVSDARQKIRTARVLLLEAAALLGFTPDDDDDDEASERAVQSLRRLLAEPSPFEE